MYKRQVYEKRGAYDTLDRVEFGGRSVWTIMDLWVADLTDPEAPATRLLPGEARGLQRVLWSPGGDRLLVTRFLDDHLEYGIVTLADRSVIWTGLTPDMPPNGAFAEWLSNQELLLLIAPDETLPAGMRYDRDLITRRSRAWEQTRQGRQASRTVIEARAGVMTTEALPARNALIRYQATGGAPEVLAESRIVDFAVSPDRNSVAVLSKADPVPLSESELVQLESESRQRLSIVSLGDTRPVVSLDEFDVTSHLLRWSPTSDAVLVWARRDGQRWSQGTLLSVGASGTTAYALDGLDFKSSVEIVAGVRADWLGGSPVVYARAGESGRADWHLVTPEASPRNLTAALTTAPTRFAAAGRDALYLSADERLWILNQQGLQALSVGGLALQEVAGGSDLYRPRRLRNEAPRRSWLTARIDESSGAGVVTIALPEATVLDRLPFESHDRVVSLSPTGALVLRRTGVAEALEFRSSEAVRQLDLVNGNLASVSLPAPIPIQHRNVEGAETTSWLFLPPGGAEHSRGLIVKAYPGWADNLVWSDPFTLTYSTRPNVFVGAGYAYLSPALPVTGPEERGDALVRGVDLAVDAALARFPGLPHDRMVLWGHSFGGYAALEIASRSQRFRSYIASSAYSDMLGVWGEFDPGARMAPEEGGLFRLNQGWTETTQGALGAPPWEHPEQYASSSPVLRADRINRPVLLLTADLDFTPVTQSERIFSAILRTGGEARMVTYWGEQHLLWSPANIRDYYAQIFDWLNRTLASPRADVTEPAPSGPPNSEPSLRSPGPS